MNLLADAGVLPTPSADVRIINGNKVVESPPGTPLPEGVPPWAFRCEIVEEPNSDLAWRPWILGSSIAVIVTGLIATWRGFNWGFAPVPLACMGIWWSLRWAGTENTIELRPASDGRYLAFDDREPAGESDNSGDAASVVFGILIFGIAAVIQFSGDRSDWYVVGTLVTLGVGMVYHGITGRELNSNEPHIPPSTAQFRALADPRRPLDATSSASSDTEKKPS